MWKPKLSHKENNSQQAWLDYSRYDGGHNATEIFMDLLPQNLHNRMTEFYKAKVIVTETQIEVIKQDTLGQGRMMIQGINDLLKDNWEL